MVSCPRRARWAGPVPGPGCKGVAIPSSLRELLEPLVGDAALAPEDRLGDYAVEGRVPRAVAFPTGEEQLASVLALADEHGLTVVPRGNGNLIALGNPPQSVDIVVGTYGLAHEIDHRPDDLTVTVSGGVTLGVLQEKLAVAGQWLPLDPPLAAQRSIGGILATDGSGPLCLSRGTARDMVIGMRVATTAGEVTKSGGRVVKNVTGFDLPKLHIGALGTLGVILEASFKVWPKPAEDTTLLAAFDSLGGAIDVIQELLTLAIAPDAAEVAMPGADGAPTGIAYLRFLGLPLSVGRRLEEARQWLQGAGAGSVSVADAQAVAGAWRQIADFGWDDQAQSGLLVRLGCLPSRTGELAAEVLREHAEGSLVVGPGRGVLRWYLPGTSTLDVSAVRADISRVQELAASVDGYAVVERCAPEAKAGLDVWGHPGDGLALIMRIKEQMDPHHILNRGRYLAGIA